MVFTARVKLLILNIMSNNTKEEKKMKEIDELEKQINELSAKKGKIIKAEEDGVQKPRCRAMVGWCLKSDYGDSCYAKILETVEPKNGYFYFIMEEIKITDGGCGEIKITNHHYPYLNKEWWNEEVPISGWERISEERYFIEKAKVVKEMSSRKKARHYIIKSNKK